MKRPLDEIIEAIVRADKCPREIAEQVAQELEFLHGDLCADFEEWLSCGGIPELPNIHGYSPKRLVDEGWSTTVAGAYTWLDGLLKDPAQTLEMLKHGYDVLEPHPSTWVPDKST